MARAFCIAVGGATALLGLAGLVLPLGFSVSHDLVHVVTGLLLVAGAWLPPLCFVFAAAYVIAPITGLVPTGPLETVLHALLVLGALAAGAGGGLGLRARRA
jgi:hypothetical protein